MNAFFSKIELEFEAEEFKDWMQKHPRDHSIRLELTEKPQTNEQRTKKSESNSTFLEMYRAQRTSH